MMGSGETKVLILGGESYFETSEDNAVQFCEDEVERIQKTIQNLKEVEDAILSEQGDLKNNLYSRFGKSINLEE
jgi:chaperonin cofactor prefoldin